MHERIAIINGHPDQESLCAALALAYKKGAIKNGAEVRSINIRELNFDLNLQYGYRQRSELEPDLVAAQETIRWADHLVFVYPIWWATVPALLKGFLDRILLPGFAYRSRPNSLLFDKLLTGKSARLIVTMDAPAWAHLLLYRRAGHRVMKMGTLQFCGVNPVSITEICKVKESTPQQRERWLAQVEKMGAKRA